MVNVDWIKRNNETISIFIKMNFTRRNRPESTFRCEKWKRLDWNWERMHSQLAWRTLLESTRQKCTKLLKGRNNTKKFLQFIFHILYYQMLRKVSEFKIKKSSIPFKNLKSVAHAAVCRHVGGLLKNREFEAFIHRWYSFLKINLKLNSRYGLNFYCCVSSLGADDSTWKSGLLLEECSSGLVLWSGKRSNRKNEKTRYFLWFRKRFFNLM